MFDTQTVWDGNAVPPRLEMCKAAQSRSFCLPCASPLLFKRGNMFSLFVSSSGSPRMGEMMRSTGGAEDEGGQAATEMTLADSEMRVKLFCVHKYVTQLPVFFIYFYYLAGVCTHRPLYEVDNQAIMWRRVSAFGHVLELKWAAAKSEPDWAPVLCVSTANLVLFSTTSLLGQG